MIQLDERFYEGEWRCGFYVQSEMKRVWAAQMEVLLEIDRICKKHNIKYFADSGTLLGTIRHKGFIPWDDDIDIAMLREDYNKFRNIALKELDAVYGLKYVGCEGVWDQPFMRVLNGSLADFSEEHMQRFHGCPYVVGVDIFPLDYLPKDSAEQDVMYGLFQQLVVLNGYIERENTDEKKREELIAEVEENTQIHFDRKQDMKKQVISLMEKCACLYSNEECEEVVCYAFWAEGGGKCRYRKEWFEKIIYMPFEKIMIPVPEQYDNVLKAIYGDYMQPVKNKAGHDYPFYKEQKKCLEENKIVYTGTGYIKLS